MGDAFVITGGADDETHTGRVVHYSPGVSGSAWLTSRLDQLNTHRYDHGCSMYMDDSQRQVRLVTCLYSYLLTTDHVHVQVLLVTGGIGGRIGSRCRHPDCRLSSTEIFVPSEPGSLEGIWETVGELPTAREGLRGATLNNVIYMTGE